MTRYDYDIGIIGGGAAGLTVASGAARLGARTLLIEKERELGGDCLHYGCVPSKTLIKTADIYHRIRLAPKYGLPAVTPPPVDFRRVAERIRAVIGVIQRHDSEERFCRLGARVLFGEPRFADAHTVRLDVRNLSAKYWVIATGSSPAVPPIKGLERTSFVTNREIFSLQRLPESMIILGGGPVGTEMSQAFCRLGTRVTVVTRGDQILAKEDRDMADAVLDVLKTEGVVFHLNSSIEEVKDLGRRKEVRIKDPAGKTSLLQAEIILTALGRAANVNGLGLKEIGIKAGRRGIAVDSRLRTAQKHIFAAGDVTGGYQFTHAAGYEGGIVVSNAVFRLPRKADYTYLPWCTYSQPELASIGLNEKRAAAAGIEYSLWREAFQDNDRSLAEGEPIGQVKMLLDKNERPIGIQILGPHAGDLLSEWVAVLNGRVKLATLAAAVHPYPTLGEINKRIAGNYLATKIFSKKVQKGLRFFFSLKGRACTPGEEFEGMGEA